VSVTPADGNLLIDSDDELLGDDQRIIFHQTVAKLLFLVKRTRLDALLVISKLSSRVTKATVSDWNKLVRLIQYLNGTADYGIFLPWNLTLNFSFYTDASYNCEPQGRSRSGAVFAVDDIVLSAWTNKQALVSLSSTEAEVIGLSDGLLTALWLKHLLTDIGYLHGPLKVFQDNTSAITIITDGRKSNHRTKHIDVRYFHAIDCVARGDIDVEYIPSGKMLADYFTKPLVDKAFYKLRDNIARKVCTTDDREHQS
jgi:hypothetical protein